VAATPEVSTTTPLPLTPRHQEAAASVARRVGDYLDLPVDKDPV